MGNMKAKPTRSRLFASGKKTASEKDQPGIPSSGMKLSTEDKNGRSAMPSPHLVREDEMPLWGVPLAFLQTWTMENVPDKTETTMQLCSRVVLPTTKDRRLSLAEYWGFDYRKANRFISHSWSYSFAEVVATLVSHEESCGSKLDEVFVWIDTLVVNQHDAPVRKQDWWSSTFHNAIKEIGSVILVVQPWFDPKALTRAWCLWEIYGTTRFGADFHIALPPGQKQHFIRTLITDFKSIQKMLSLVDSAKAEATNASDLAMIRKEIELSIGYEGVNRMVLTQIRSWLVESALEALQDLNAGSLAQTAPELTNRTGQALLENQIAKLYNLQGELVLAMNHQQQAYSLDKQEEAENISSRDIQFRLSRDLNNLGYLSLKIGDLSNAVSYLCKARDIRVEVFGKTSPEVARTEFNLGEVHETRGALEECIALYNASAEALIAANLGQDALKVYQGLGRVHRLRGDFKLSEECFKRALELGGPESVHPDVAEVWGMYAALLTDTDRFEEAEKALNSALAIQVRNLGSTHPNVAEIANNQARLLCRLGNYKEALTRQREAMHIDQKAFGETHLVVARDCNNLGHLLTQLGRLDEAKEAMKRAMNIRERALGVHHPLYARSLCNLAKVEMVSGNLQSALDKYRQARQVMNHVNPNHQDIGEIDSMIAECQFAAGDYDASELSFKQAIGNAECPDSSKVAWKLLLAKCLTDHAKFDEAKHELDDAEAISNAVCAKLQENIYTVDLFSGRARWMEATGDFKGAIAQQRLALKYNELSGTDNTLDTARDLNNLGFLLTERPTSVEELREGIEALRKALEIRNTALGTNNPATLRTRYNFGLALFELESEGLEALQIMNECCEALDKGSNAVHALVAQLGLLKLRLFAEEHNDALKLHSLEYFRSHEDWITTKLDSSNPLRLECLVVMAYAEKLHDELQKRVALYQSCLGNSRTNMNVPLFILWTAEGEADPERKRELAQRALNLCTEELGLYVEHRFVQRCQAYLT